MPVGPDGCPLDSDGDGIPDYLDECPRTPAGAKVLPNGCALQGDCRTPRPGEQVDANGCAVDRNFILKGVKFEFDSDRLTEEAKQILGDVAETLKAYPNLSVELEGHTDSLGSDAYNLGLSERRANTVKVFLTGKGIPAKRMTSVGYGKTRPIDTNETEEGRDNNRRVELKPQE
ncbi:OmpA family protein [Sinimarinibacterium sp. NLF-5-8]|nr:OmpA family protein [Sinimarinibacterium sp. NLF-5-8]